MANVEAYGCSSREGRLIPTQSIQAISIAPLQSPTFQKRSRHSTYTVSEFHAETPLTSVSEGFVQGPYMAARAGFEPATLRKKDVESTNELPLPTIAARG